jgi:hypothetical protein
MTQVVECMSNKHKEFQHQNCTPYQKKDPRQICTHTDIF